MKVGQYSGISFGVFLGIITLSIYIRVYYFCCKQKNPSLAFFTLFSFLSIYILNEWIRQGLATVLVMIAVIQLKRNKTGLFFIIVLFSCLFHAASIMSVFYYFINKSNKQKLNIIYSSAIILFLLFALYNPDIIASIPIVGDKVAAYGAILQATNVGLWDYILTSKVVFVYLAIVFFIKIFFSKVKDSNLYVSKSLVSMYFLFLSRLTPALVRVGYFYVPFLIIDLDMAFSRVNTGFKTKPVKLIYMLFILMVSTMPAWNGAFYYGSQSFLTIFSSSNEINSEISKKCKIINEYSETHTIARCL
jgi:hypothetical protein